MFGFIPATFRAEIVLGLWFVLQLFDGIGGGLGSDVNCGVAYWAHVGGFLFGVVTTLVLFGRGAPTTPVPEGYAEPGSPSPAGDRVGISTSRSDDRNRQGVKPCSSRCPVTSLS